MDQLDLNNMVVVEKDDEILSYLRDLIDETRQNRFSWSRLGRLQEDQRSSP